MLEHMNALIQRRPGFGNERLEVVQAANNTSLDDELVPPGRDATAVAVDAFIDHANLEKKAQVLNPANMYLGGGLLNPKGRGWVFEEQQAAFTTILPYLLGENPRRRTQTRSTSSATFRSRDFTPVLYRGVRALGAITEADSLASPSEAPGNPRNIHTNPDFDPANTFTAVDDANPFDVISIAAPTLKDDQRGKPYDMDTVVDMAGSFAAGVKLLDPTRPLLSALWGAGVFNHSPAMSMAVQMLVCRFYGVDLRIHGVKAEHQGAFDQARRTVEEIWASAVERQRAGESIALRDLAAALSYHDNAKQWTTRPLPKSRPGH
jgi:hypothetical protein